MANKANMSKFERKFFDVLERVFIGDKAVRPYSAENKSGFLKLIRYKSNYFNNIVYPSIKEKIKKTINTEKLDDEKGNFRDDLYTKLYDFFAKYFSESGSVFYSNVLDRDNIYKKLYAQGADTTLFWKTQGLYYVKSETIYNDMEIEIDTEKGSTAMFYFNCDKLIPLGSNIKKELVFGYEGIINLSGKKAIKLVADYNGKTRVTKTDEILKAVKKDYDDDLDTEDIENAIAKFKKQSEVDFFINKNAGKFLQEELNTYMYNFVIVHSPDTIFEQKRLRQLQVVRDVALEVIKHFSQFEDELVRIWNKPKFVFNTNYVVTLGRLVYHSRLCRETGVNSSENPPSCHSCTRLKPSSVNSSRNPVTDPSCHSRESGNPVSLIEKIINHPGFKNQLKEWQELGFVDDKFDANDILKSPLNPPLLKGEEGGFLNPKYQHLPIDTKYFKGNVIARSEATKQSTDENLELEILSLFENLDNELDGTLIKSDNYQALNTILPKYREKVQTIYIDPPFNLGTNADFNYKVGYKDSTWATLLENRLELAKEMLNKKGSIFVRCDYNGNYLVRHLLNDVFGSENFRNEIIIKKNQSLPKTGDKNLTEHTESLFSFSKTDDFGVKKILLDKEPEWVILGTRPAEKEDNPPRIVEGKKFYPPKNRRWSYSQESIDNMYKNKRLKLENGKIKILLDKKSLGDNWTDIPAYSNIPLWGLKTENSEILLNRVIKTASNDPVCHHSFESINPEIASHKPHMVYGRNDKLNENSKKRDLICDFFLGSGTTTAVAHKLGRKWLGVEMGDHFYTVIIPRMKKVLFYDKSGISKEIKQYKGGGFFKYYELESYEQALRKSKYDSNNEILDKVNNIYDEYMFLGDLKLAECIEIDKKRKKLNINLSKLYNEKEDGKKIDLAETISNITGKEIKRIEKDAVYFTDNTKQNLNTTEMTEAEKTDFLRTIRDLIWWGK